MLSRKVAIVTGGANGIGVAVARRFLAEGAEAVVIADIDKNGESVAKSLSEGKKNDAGQPRAIFMLVDASVEEQVKKCVEATVAQFGRLDVLVNNAVVFEFGHLLEPGTMSGSETDKEITSQAWERVWNVNVRGYANFIKHAGQAMCRNELQGETYENVQKAGTSAIDARDRGAIVNISSVSGFIAQPELVPYNCSKAAILQLTRCCALDFSKHKVRVNAISPGTIETEGAHNHMKMLGLGLDEGRKAFGDSCLLKRQGAPEEIASGVAFLASHNSSFMTGANIVADGGATI